MKFVGLDLAWGEVAWTGVAVLDASGRLVSMDRVRTDEDIAHRLQPHLGGPVLVLIEIVSPATAGMDPVLKPVEYAAVGVPYSWRVQT